MKFFIGSAGTSLPIAYRIERILKEDLERDVTVWDNAAFAASKFTLEALLDMLDEYDAGIFIFSKDDVIEKKDPEGVQGFVPRDNVILEAGLFMGKKGRSNTCIFSTKGVQRPTDVDGLTYIDYNASDEAIHKGLRLWLAGIKAPAGFSFGSRYELDHRVADPLREAWRFAKTITFVGYAASAFTLSSNLSDAYHSSFRDFYLEKVAEGTHFRFVLTKPNSFADRDAAKYKMAIASKFDTSQIITKAVEAVKRDIEVYGDRIELKVCEIAFPYALLYVKNDPMHAEDDYIQLDLYSPLLGEDQKRRKTIIKRNDGENFTFFHSNITAIWNRAQRV